MTNSPSLSASATAFTALALLLLQAAAARADAGLCGDQEGPVCRGCNMVVVCIALDGVNVTEADSVLCPEDAPFCAEGICVKDEPAENACGLQPTPSDAAASPFRCPQGVDGYLPDPRDCSRYHYCQDGQGWDLACNVQPATVYQHASASCVVPEQTPCPAAVDCPADANRTYSLYDQENRVAFRCEAGVVDVLQCPVNHRLDVDAAPQDGVEPACVRFCPRAGRQASPTDETAYYECLEVGDGGRMGHPVLTACPEGTRFDAGQERCLVAQQ